MTETTRDIVGRLRDAGAGDAFHAIESCTHAPDRGVWESICAFGNGSGGTVVFGLDASRGFAPLGDFAPDEMRRRLVAGMAEGSAESALVNPPQYDIRLDEFDGSRVLVMTVRELDARFKPCFLAEGGLQNASYKRVGGANEKLSAAEIDELKGAVLPNDAEIAPVAQAGVDDLDMAQVARMAERRRRKSPRALRGALTQSAQLERLNIVGKQGDVRLMGLLAVGFYPQQFFPRLTIDVSVHDGAGPRPVERAVCDGSLPEMIDDALAALSRVLGRREARGASSSSDEWEIPRAVLREALANAVAHREYGGYFLGRPVSVDVYPDKVVVANPGGLWGGKSLENLADGMSCCRNPRLMQLMEAASLASDGACVADGSGSGLSTMAASLDACALARPVFDVSPDRFAVTFRRPARKSASSASRALPYRQDALFADERAARRRDGDRAHVGGLPSAQDAGFGRITPPALPSDRDAEVLMRRATAGSSIERSIVDLLAAEGAPLAAREIADALHIEMSAFRYRVKKLVDAGVVEATASATSKKRRYVLVRGGTLPRE